MKNIALWILQVLLAAFFVWHGWLYLFEMAEMMNTIITSELRIFIGVAEWLAAAGLILPGITRVLPRLTVFAAAGLMILTGSAVVFHLSRGENAVMQALLFVLAAIVAYVRWRIIPLSPKGNREQTSV